MDLKTVANNMMNNVPKVYLRRTNLSTSSSLGSSTKEGNQRFHTYFL